MRQLNERQITSIRTHDTRSEVAEGLRYTPSRANSNTATLLEVSSFAYAAIELLAEQGSIDIEVLDRKKKDVADRLVEKFRQEGIGAAYQRLRATNSEPGIRQAFGTI